VKQPQLAPSMPHRLERGRCCTCRCSACCTASACRCHSPYRSLSTAWHLRGCGPRQLPAAYPPLHRVYLRVKKQHSDMQSQVSTGSRCNASVWLHPSPTAGAAAITADSAAVLVQHDAGHTVSCKLAHKTNPVRTGERRFLLAACTTAHHQVLAHV
jgi:hypothetical protein